MPLKQNKKNIYKLQIQNTFNKEVLVEKEYSIYTHPKDALKDILMDWKDDGVTFVFKLNL
jgi:hypothetical protein